MLNQAQDFAEFGQAQFDKMIKLSSVLLSNAERLANLQLDLSRKALSDNAETFKALSESKDPKSIADVHSSMIQPRIEQVFSAAHQVYDVGLATQNELNKLIEEQLTDLNKSILGAIDQVSKHAPGGSDVALGVFKEFVNSTNSAFSSVSETARKVGAQLAEAGVEAASSSAKAASAAASRAATSASKKTAA